MADPSSPTLVVGRPSGNSLVRDYLAGEAATEPFFGSRFDRLSAFGEKASEVDGRFDRTLRQRAADALTVPEQGGAERLERFVEDGGYVVTTGQQPALFGGPLTDFTSITTRAWYVQSGSIYCMKYS